MDRPTPDTQPGKMPPEVFFAYTHELMKNRKQLTRDDLYGIAAEPTTPRALGEFANVMLEHFDEVRSMAQEKRPGNSTFADYHNQLFSEPQAKPDDPTAPDPERAITKEDLTAMKHVFDHSEERSYLNWASSGRIAKRSFQMAFSGGMGMIFGGCAVGDPEPFVKALCIIGTGASITATYEYGQDLFSPASSMLRKEYSDRQEKIDSWNYFNRKAALK